jgi:hypothetical protein
MNIYRDACIRITNLAKKDSNTHPQVNQDVDLKFKNKKAEISLNTYG